jgi:hypothetical protein
MATNAPRSQSGAAAAAKPAPAPSQQPVRPRVDPVSAAGAAGVAKSDAGRKIAGYGLPCAKCNLYYPADLDACPTCHHKERVSPVVPRIARKAAQTPAAPVPDTTVLEKEREEFLRQFKSQLVEAHAEATNAPESFCTFSDHHTDEPASAEVCKGCYELLQERLDIHEAALHIDLKEAAQIIYDAVWADPSDPNKTYQNAASALLAELRKRSGMTSLHAPFQPLTD